MCDFVPRQGLAALIPHAGGHQDGAEISESRNDDVEGSAKGSYPRPQRQGSRDTCVAKVSPEDTWGWAVQEIDGLVSQELDVASLGLVDVRKFEQWRKYSLKVRGMIATWPDPPSRCEVVALVVFTDGSAEMSVGWPRVPATAGSGAVFFGTGPEGQRY